MFQDNTCTRVTCKQQRKKKTKENENLLNENARTYRIGCTREDVALSLVGLQFTNHFTPEWLSQVTVVNYVVVYDISHLNEFKSNLSSEDNRVCMEVYFKDNLS